MRRTLTAWTIRKWARKLRKIAALALVVPMVATMQIGAENVGAQSAVHAQSALVQLAARHPADTVEVIVQKTTKDRSVEGMVAELGGKVTKELHIINAVVAQMPAGAAVELSTRHGVRWVSLDTTVVKTGSLCPLCIGTNNLANAYVRTIGADQLWNNALDPIQGQGIGVAVVDTGISRQQDFKSTTSGFSRVVTTTNFLVGTQNMSDQYGHGTHVAGIIGGNGARSSGTYIGVAPRVTLISAKVSDNNGVAQSSDVVSALEWVLDNKAQYNIRVVNLSFSASAPDSYLTNPLNAAVEILWFNGIVVVVSAGNGGSGGVLNPPANDPFVITVGASMDQGTADPADDTVAPYSSYGFTEDGFSKPDLVAPGHNIVSVLANSGVQLADDHPANVVTYNGSPWYFRMSGTSMAAAVTSGAAALLLQDQPNLTPDQVKYRLMATAHCMSGAGAGAGELNVYAAVQAVGMHNSANTGLPANQLLWTGSTPVNWDSVNWNSVNWNSVNWTSVNWTSVNWNSVNWNSVNWTGIYWEP